MRVVHGQSVLGSVEVGQYRARLHGHARVTSEPIRLFNDNISTRKRSIHGSVVDCSRKAQVIAQFRVDEGRVRVQRPLHIRDDGQLVPFNPQVCECIFSLMPGFSDHRKDRFALPT